MDDKEKGLYPKYVVYKMLSEFDISDEPVQDRVFVLNPQTDPIARDALRAYATAAGAAGYFQLRQDIHDWIDEVEGR